MRKLSGVVAIVAIASVTQAAIVVNDSFTNATLNTTLWNTTSGSPVTLDTVNKWVTYAHTAGTVRRWGNLSSPSPSILTNKVGYLKATISGFTGSPSILFGFWGSNPANNTHFASTVIGGNGVYEVFFNNTSGSLSFDNGAGWSGILGSGAGLWSTNGGTTSAAITVGAGIAVNTTLFGFGFANFGNTTTYPSSSFNIEDVLVSDTLVLSTGPSTLATKLVITSSPKTTTAGVSSSAITVQRQDASSTPITSDANLTVNLSTSASGTGVFRDAGDAGNITSVVISNGLSSATFLYRDTLAGSPTLTLAATGLTSTNQQETVTPAAIASYVVSAGASQAVGVPFNTTVTAKDQYNNTVTTDSSTVVTMTSSGATVFDSNADNTFGDNTKPLVNGTFTIRTKDGTAQTMTITATDGNSKTGTSSSISVIAHNPATVVDWDGTGGFVVTANQNITQTTTFNTASYQSPAQGASYYPNSITNLHNPNFYAALSSTADLSSWNIFNGAVNDLVGRIQVTGAASGTRSAMLAWDVNTTNALESFVLRGFGAFGDPANSNRTVRFLFQASNDNWYASEAIVGTGSDFDVVLANAAATNWYAYTPHSSGVATIGALASPVFTHAKRVGYYQEFSTASGGGIYAYRFVVTDNSYHVPVANSHATSVAQGGVVNIPLNYGKGVLGSTAEGHPLTLSVVSSPANGAAVSDGSSLTYTNTSGAPGSNDSFEFAVTDEFGGAATNTVTVTLTSATGANLVSATASGGDAHLTFLGIPGTNYVLEWTTSISYPIVWQAINTNQAATNGYLRFTNNLSMYPTNDFFRTQAQ